MVMAGTNTVSEMPPRNHTRTMTVVDGSGEDAPNRPFPAMLYAVLTAVIMLTALLVSFVRFQRRRLVARKNEKEYQDQFETILPGSNYHERKILRARTIMTNTHLGFIPPPTFSNPGAKQRLPIPKWSEQDPIPETSKMNVNAQPPDYSDISMQGIYSQDTNKLTTNANVHSERDDIFSVEIDYPFADASEEDLTVLKNASHTPKIKTRHANTTEAQNIKKLLMARAKQFHTRPGSTQRDRDHDINHTRRQPHLRATNREKGNTINNDSTGPYCKDSSVPSREHPETNSRNKTPDESGYIVRLMEPFNNERRFSVPDVFPFPDDEPVDLSKTIASDDDQMYGYYWENGLPQQRQYRRKKKKKTFPSHANPMLPSDTQTFLTKPADDQSERSSGTPDNPTRNTGLVPVLNVAYFRRMQTDSADNFNENFLLLDKYRRQTPDDDDTVLHESHKLECSTKL